MVMRTWSEQVKGREVTQPLTKGRSTGFAKERSITEGRALPERGNLVYSPGEFMSAKRHIAANCKYGEEEETSCEEKERSGSGRRLWMFRSPTTESGMPMSGKRVSAGTEWTVRSPALIE